MSESKNEKGFTLPSSQLLWLRSTRGIYHGTQLVKLREKTGLTQEEFASKCGWTRQYQSRLELPFEHEITASKRETINTVAETLLHNKRQ